MKENVIDVLLYLFENYIDTENSSQPDKDVLELELEQVGFQEMEIHKALDWLDNMTVVAPQTDNPNTHIRVFSESVSIFIVEAIYCFWNRSVFWMSKLAKLLLNVYWH